jgi:hypothetical protein
MGMKKDHKGSAKSNGNSDISVANAGVLVIPEPPQKELAIADAHLLDTGMADIESKEVLRVLTEVKNGNFAVRMPIDKVGTIRSMKSYR